MLVCCRSQSRSIICLFHFFLSKSGLDVFYHWYFSGNSSVYVSQNIEISSYFGLIISLLVLLVLTFFWLKATTQVSHLVVQSTLRKSFQCCFFVTSETLGDFPKGQKAWTNWQGHPLVLVKNTFKVAQYSLQFPFVLTL